MDFYRELSRHYDEIFPAREAETAFVRELLAGARRILDIGCATGSKTVLLKTAEGESVTGIDADREMIKTARRRHPDSGVTFLTLDMRELAGVFAPGSLDGAVCLGNTLAHLTQPGELVNFFRQTRTLLRPDGALVAQLINYTRIIQRHIDSLPVIETPNLTFIRRYEWRDADMHFVCDLRLTTGEEYHFDTILRPILKSALDGALEAAGYGPAEYFGGFGGEPYDDDSYHIIFRARP